MKKIFSTLILSLITLTIFAQADPVLMTVGHFKVTRGEFEYAYNKNSGQQGAVEEKTVEEYADMYLNYKLKVLAAEDAGLDTVGSLLTEFRTYRDMQLMNYLVDETFIDSIARSYYDQTAEQLGGKDIIHLSHILLKVPADATAEQKEAIHKRADSIYTAIMAGADFAELAAQFSEDGTARNGGALPPAGPGMFVKEFEDAAYPLQVGEVSRPILTAFGYHIIKMRDRKALEPYAQLRDIIVNNLKRQGIEEVSAENRINKLIAASGGTLTREAILDSVMHAHVGQDANLRYLIQEYREGLLLYEAAQNQVFTPSKTDEAGLQRYYEENRAKYAWTAPHFKGYVVQAKTKKILKRAVSFVKKHAGADNLSALIDAEFNGSGVQVRVSKLLVAKAGENTMIDRLVFGGKSQPLAAFPFEKAVGKKLKQPEDYKDVELQVVGDYQQYLEQQWIEQLRQRYPYQINEAVLKTVNQHE